MMLATLSRRQPDDVVIFAGVIVVSLCRLPTDECRCPAAKSACGRTTGRCACPRCSTGRVVRLNRGALLGAAPTPVTNPSSAGPANRQRPPPGRALPRRRRIDLVRRERRRMDRHPAADVAADLADPDLLAVVTHRAAPEAQVIALVDVVARLLQRKVLWAPIQVQVADRRVRVTFPCQRGTDHLHHRARPGRFARAPAPANERRKGVFDASDDHQIERIAVLGAALVGHAAGQCLECREERLVIGKFDDVLRAV